MFHLSFCRSRTTIEVIVALRRMSRCLLLHENRRLWQRHVLAENRRSIEGLLETLCVDPIYKIMATSATFKGREQVVAILHRLV